MGADDKRFDTKRPENFELNCLEEHLVAGQSFFQYSQVLESKIIDLKWS